MFRPGLLWRLHPFAGPVQVSGTVRNQADALVLEGTAETTLELVCDRCLKPFCRDMRVPVDSLLAETLEDEENDEILLLDNGTVDLDEVFTTALVLAMDSKHVCCRGLQGAVRHLRRGSQRGTLRLQA